MNTNKTAIVAHITIVGFLVAMIMNRGKKDHFSSFYIKQNMGIALLFFIFGLLFSLVPNQYAGYGFFLVVFVLWTYSFIGALSGEYKLLPIIGKYFQQWFKQIEL